MSRRVNFSAPYLAGLEGSYINHCLTAASWHGDGEYTAKVTEWLVTKTGAQSALMTTSCTHALELAGLLLELKPGDEVICPSFTFASTAAAIAIRGATPVFVDVLPDTMNIDPAAVDAAITDRTIAIYVVHYGGVAVDLDLLVPLARRHGLHVVEDNAHGIGATFRGQHLGTFGTFGTQSWHDTKNVTCGEGGALLINDPSFVRRAQIHREKGTNRARFCRGPLDKYTWVDHGSSYLPAEPLMALLHAQFQRFDHIQSRRHQIWSRYATELVAWAHSQSVRLMSIPGDRVHPAHLFYLVMPSRSDQPRVLQHLLNHNIVATFHYQPLHSSEAGRRLGRTPHPCDVATDQSSRLVRLPLHPGLTEGDVDRVVETLTRYRVCGA